MKIFSINNVKLTSGYLYDKQELNRTTTINAVYDVFAQTGRIGAFDFNYDPADPESIQPHFFWDSDVAKWIEGAANITWNNRSPELEKKVDAIVEKIKEHQEENGYFNIYFTVVEPENRFKDRRKHELYCAGHLIEAAIAYDRATGKRDFLDCMEKYADLIYKVFFIEKSAEFTTPGHQEIELALVRLYRYTGKKKYLDLAKFFIDNRGVVEELRMDEHYQTHKPLREQTEAVGHSVRAMYLFTAMAMVAKETNDTELAEQCRTLWEDVVFKKMYVTGGLGSTYLGEGFTVPYDMPNDTSYAETCAAIGLMFFSNEMLSLENNARYADIVEKCLYNGVLSGISIDGRSFFYENPLEINTKEKFEFRGNSRRFPITQRVEVFSVSCCPPNLNRLLSSLGNYIYGTDGDTLYVNQYISSVLNDGEIKCTLSTEYPNDGIIKISASGTNRIALRIPAWCRSFKLNKPYTMEKGYAAIENDGSDIELCLDMSVRAVYADPRIRTNVGKVCITRGPVVYCAEAVDNGDELCRFVIPNNPVSKENIDPEIGLVALEIDCEKQIGFENTCYSYNAPKLKKATLKLIPFNYFANRGESDMMVWFGYEYQ